MRAFFSLLILVSCASNEYQHREGYKSSKQDLSQTNKRIAELTLPQTSAGDVTSELASVAPPAIDSVLIAKPPPVTTAFRNPRMGWVVYDFYPFTDKPVANTPLASVIFSNFFSWGDLEPVEGQYDFSGIDNMLSKALPGQKIAIAITTMDLTSHPSARPHMGFKGRGQTPFWLQQKMGPYAGDCISSVGSLQITHDPSDPYGCVLRPYYWHPTFLAAHKKLITALAKRYSSPSPGEVSWRNRLESIEISTFGHWGEWHAVDVPWPDYTYQKATTLAMVNDYLTAFAPFPEVKLEISGVVSRVAPASWAGPGADLTNIYHAVNQGANIGRKFIGAYEPAYFSPLEAALLQQWRGARALRLEWGSWSGKIFDFLDASYPTYRGYVTTAVQRALELQASHLGWHVNQEKIFCGPGPVTFNNCSTRQDIPLRREVAFDPLSIQIGGETLRDYAQRRLGYRLQLAEARLPQRLKAGGGLGVAMRWHQLGVAKVYDQYKLKFWLTRAAADDVLLGEGAFPANHWPVGPQADQAVNVSGLKVPMNTASGWWTVKFAVVDTTGEPAMNLAIDGKEIADPNLYARYRLGEVFVD
jgi:hypothetical protein